jgi:DNA processing protein
MLTDELRSWLILARTPGIHAGVLDRLLRRFASLDEIVTASAPELLNAELPPQSICALTNPDLQQLDFDCRWLESTGNTLLTCRSPGYPSLLKQISDPPAVLFVRGKVAALSLPQIAIVGSRNPTAGGRENAESFAAHLASCGLAITSGLAVGIDAASHTGALHAKGVTVAVCATGLDTVYPRTHEKLATLIAEQGAVISEFPPNTPAHKFHFPRRNRIISALSLGTLVVEAAVHSGSLITAKCAVEQCREVFAIPGSIHNPMARGCHQLLRMGAKLVETADDILAELGPLAAAARADSTALTTRNSAQFSGAQLDKDYKMLLDALGFDPVSIDVLVDRSGLRPEAVASMLLIMELDGRIESLPGASYVRMAGE